jgi:hypothetical protein
MRIFRLMQRNPPPPHWLKGGWGDLCADGEVGEALSVEDRGWKPLPQNQFSTFLQAKFV